MMKLNYLGLTILRCVGAFRRIAEVKENERRRALEDILYALVVQKFVEAGVSLVHAISRSDDPFGRVDLQEEKLERLHSSDAYAMIESAGTY